MNKKKVKANIKYFKTCVKEAIDFLELHSYQFEVTEQIKDGVRASNYYHSLHDCPNAGARIYNIAYSLDWINNKDTTKEDIRRTAFHEIFESMFSRLRDFSYNEQYIVMEREVDDNIHEIVRTFEKKILPLIKEKKF